MSFDLVLPGTPVSPFGVQSDKRDTSESVTVVIVGCSVVGLAVMITLIAYCVRYYQKKYSNENREQNIDQDSVSVSSSRELIASMEVSLSQIENFVYEVRNSDCSIQFQPAVGEKEDNASLVEIEDYPLSERFPAIVVIV